MSPLLVSLIIIALNEENSLPILLNNIKNQNYDHSFIEVILVDSMSNDKTKLIMNDFRTNSDFKRVICDINPKIIQACGWNVALKHVTGEVIIRLDAHASIPFDFITKNINCLLQGHDICGGKVKNFMADPSKWNEIVNLAEDSMFGGSIAAFRHQEKEGYVKTLAFSAYRKYVFDKVGFFNETLVRTEDNEMHYRMRSSGFKFYYNPQIVSFRETRSSLSRLIKQKFANGYWIGKTFWICPRCLEKYHYVPLLFLLGIILTSFLYCIGFPVLGNIMWSLYWGLTVIMTIMAMSKCKNNLYLVALPVVFFTLHVSYGLGTLKGILKL